MMGTPCECCAKSTPIQVVDYDGLVQRVNYCAMEVGAYTLGRVQSGH